MRTRVFGCAVGNDASARAVAVACGTLMDASAPSWPVEAAA
jgi:hypothetical protein